MKLFYTIRYLVFTTIHSWAHIIFFRKKHSTEIFIGEENGVILLKFGFTIRRRTFLIYSFTLSPNQARQLAEKLAHTTIKYGAPANLPDYSLAELTGKQP